MSVGAFVAAAISFVAALVLTPLAIRLAKRMNFLDRPGGHKGHSVSVPLLGGVAVAAAVLISVGYSGLNGLSTQILGVLGAGTIMAVVGGSDDRWGLSISLRLLLQFAAGVILFVTGTQIHLFGHPVPDLLLTVFWCMAVTNAMNFIDNMDGLSTGVAAVVSLVCGVLAGIHGQLDLATLAFALFGANAGFLIFNFHPARVYLGDAGSLFIGTVLAALTIGLRFPDSPMLITWMIPPLLLGFPLLDLSFVIATRLGRGVSPAMGGRDHLSHRLHARGYSVPRTVVVLLSLTAFFALCGVIVALAGGVAALAAVLVAAGCAASFVWWTLAGPRSA